MPVQQALIERYSELVAPPTDSLNGLDSPLPPPPDSVSWHPSCFLVAGPDEPSSDAPDQAEVGNHSPKKERTRKPNQSVTWSDVALSIGAELLFKVREEILQQLGYTTSAVSMLFTE